MVCGGQVHYSALSSVISSQVEIDKCAPERIDYSLCNGITAVLSQNYTTGTEKKSTLVILSHDLPLHFL